jgi:hypothetical protein
VAAELNLYSTNLSDSLFGTLEFFTGLDGQHTVPVQIVVALAYSTRCTDPLALNKGLPVSHRRPTMLKILLMLLPNVLMV